MEILQRYANLFRVLWACLVTITQNDMYHLAEDFSVSLHTKNKLQFFLTILHLKESCNLIGQQHFGLKIDLRPKNYARYVSEVSITIIVFVIDYFQEKLTWQNFSKNPKKPYFCQFFNNRITYHCAKSQKNLKSHSWENWWRDTPKTSFCH